MSVSPDKGGAFIAFSGGTALEVSETYEQVKLALLESRGLSPLSGELPAAG
jgi:hypothetical protein